MRVLWATLTVLILDQVTKVIVLNTMYRGQSIPLVGDWLKLTFTENPGMAFGIVFGPPSMITIFSIIATFLILLYLFAVRNGFGPYRFSLALVLGGALGNIVDRVAYGAILGYAPLFQGKVVDFIHVNLWRGYLPESLPLIGGKYLALFPIWNVSDMAIVVGVVGILVFQGMHHRREQRRLNPEYGSTLATPVELEAIGQDGIPGVAAPASTGQPGPSTTATTGDDSSVTPS